MEPTRQFSSIPGLPPAMGTAEVPEGFTRMYHQTPLHNVESIRRQGLLWDKGLGIEGPKGVWISNTPFYKNASHLATIEVAAPKGVASIASVGDIPPHRILAIHEPWHDHVRDYMTRPDILRQIHSGEFDSLVSDDPHEQQVLKAVQHIRRARL